MKLKTTEETSLEKALIKNPEMFRQCERVGDYCKYCNRDFRRGPQHAICAIQKPETVWRARQMYTANPPSSLPATAEERLVQALTELANPKRCTCINDIHKPDNRHCTATIAFDALMLHHAEKAVLANIPPPMEIDATAGHSTGNWYEIQDFLNGLALMSETGPVCQFYEESSEENWEILQFPNQISNLALIQLAQSAPHNCGDPNCPGVINQRKLQLYDKFQLVVTEFAKQGLLT